VTCKTTVGKGERCEGKKWRKKEKDVKKNGEKKLTVR
jgi:hypothetical protein